MISRTTVASDAFGQARPRVIPMPAVPMYPVLSGAALRRDSVPPPSVLAAPGVRIETVSGRYAIALALRALGIGAEDAVLVPAYHCDSMIAPIVEVGARPLFYRVREDLTVDLDHVRGIVDGRARALIAVNYFGFPQDLAGLRAFCDEARLAFIEDCAHSLFGAFQGRPLGSFGDFAVASYWKFLAVRTGGCLIAGVDANLPATMGARGGIGDLLDMLHRARAYDRLRAIGPGLALSGALARLARRRPRRTPTPVAVAGGDACDFDPARIEAGPSTIVRVLAARLAAGRIVAPRRARYVELAAAFTGIRGCRPLFARLPEGVVPYVFPLVIDDLDRVFAVLEDAAVPMQRFGQFPWRGMDADLCPVSADLGRRLIQLPCHQALDAAETAWVAARVADALDAGAGR